MLVGIIVMLVGPVLLRERELVVEGLMSSSSRTQTRNIVAMLDWGRPIR
jgi:hypothetical protein